MRKAVLISACTGLIVLGSIGAVAAQSNMDRPAAPASQSKVTGAASSPSDAMAMTKKKKAKKTKTKTKKTTPAKSAPAQSAPPKSSY